MKVVAILPAKGTSSRVKSKNTRFLAGKPLFMHTLEKLLKCDFIDTVIIDSESEDILNLGCEAGAMPLKRDVSLANNNTDGNRLFMNVVNQIDADIYIQILCTSPFIEENTLRKGVDVLKNDSMFDSAVLVQKEKIYLWDENGPIYDVNNIPNSIDLDETIVETMGLYIIKKEAAILTNRRIGENPFMLEASKIEAIDIDYDDDFLLAEQIMIAKTQEETLRFNVISKFLSSAILSDILDDYGLCGFIEGINVSNFSNAKILGRATTLKLRKLNDGEDFRGIYNALSSYDNMVSGQIIFVDNSDTDYAYFGGLNGALSVSKGIKGVIVNGKTRDRAEVNNLELPVFSKGYIGKDVRKRATVESINKTIIVEGVEIKHNSLVFADCEGIVVIPKQFEDTIIVEALKKVSVESKIVTDILNKIDVDNIVNQHGDF